MKHFSYVYSFMCWPLASFGAVAGLKSFAYFLDVTTWATYDFVSF